MLVCKDSTGGNLELSNNFIASTPTVLSMEGKLLIRLPKPEKWGEDKEKGPGL